MASLVSGLDLGVLPECAAGNDPRVRLNFSLFGVYTGATYDGAVYYKGRSSYSAGDYEFSVPGLQSSTGEPVRLLVIGARTVFSEPSAGQEFWLSFGKWGQALLQSRGGALVLAYLDYRTDDAAGADWLAGLLGVSVSAKERCTSPLTSRKVWDVILGTAPPVRLQSGWLGTVELGGRIYKAWQWGEGSIEVSIYGVP